MATAKKKKESKYLMYKDKPLVRCDNTVYYGYPSDEYILMLQILDTDKTNELETAKRVSVQLMTTDPDVKLKDRTIKKTEKAGLYNAIDIGAVWLERALKNK